MSERNWKGFIGLRWIFALAVMAIAGGADALGQAAPESGKRESLWGGRRERLESADRGRAPRGSSRSARLGSRIRRESYFRYHRIGGDEGIDRLLTLRGDGTLKLRENGRVTKSAKLAPADLRLIAQYIKNRCRFKELEDHYGDKTDDPFQATITFVAHVARRSQPGSAGKTVRGASGQDRTVTVYVGPENQLPLEVERLVTDLEDLIEKRLSSRPEMQVEFDGVAAAGMIDRHVYRFERAEEPVAPELWFHLSVVNFTDEPLQLRFDTKQAYEIVIRNRAGEEAFRWSSGKTFEEQPTEMQLVRDWLSYIERIPLSGPDGAPFPPGDYTISYELRSVPAFRGETTFRIEETEPQEKKQKGLRAKYRADARKVQAAAAEARKKAGAGSAAPGKGAKNKAPGGKRGKKNRGG